MDSTFWSASSSFTKCSRRCAFMASTKSYTHAHNVTKRNAFTIATPEVCNELVTMVGPWGSQMLTVLITAS